MPEKCRAGHRVKTGASAKREESREKFAGFSEDAIVEDGAVCGSFRADIESFGARRDLRDETGGGLNGARSANGDKHAAIAESFKNAIEMEWRFTEPANVRANHSPAFAQRESCGRFINTGVVEWRFVAGIAAAFP